MHTFKVKGLRWWMISLVMLGAIINYLTRSTLAVAAPTLLKDLHITAQEYSWIVGTFQVAIMLQPICGYVLDVLGLKRGFAIFAMAWSLISMAHGLAHSWPRLAALRGLLGFAEGSANPAGMKATAEWFPARERGLAGGVYNIGASVGSMLAPPLVVWAILTYNWQMAFVITGSLGLVWVALWLLLYQSPETHPRLSDERARVYRRRTGVAPARRRPTPVDRLDRTAAQLLGHRAAAVSRRPDLGHADLLGAALPDDGAALRPEADRAVRLDAVSGRGPRMSVWRRAGDGAAEARRQPDQRAALGLHGGRVPDDGHGLCRRGREPLRGHRASQPGRLRAPDAVGDGDHDVVRSVQTQRSRHGRRHGGHVRQRRAAGLLAAHRRPGRHGRLHAVFRRPRRARPGRRGGVVDGRPRSRRRSSHDHPQSDPARLQSRSRRSSVSATTTTSRRRPSSGFPACRSITRATWCTGGC